MKPTKINTIGVNVKKKNRLEVMSDLADTEKKKISEHENILKIKTI